MDTLLINGDFAPGSTGKPKAADGTAELFQRAMIRLNVPLGGFAYDASLGSRLHTLSTADPELETKALAAAQEALRPIGAVTAAGVCRLSGTPETITVRCVCGEEEREIEVKL